MNLTFLKQKEDECKQIKENDERNASIKYSESCRIIWDGIYCWPRSNQGEIVNISCPDYIEGFDSTEYATKSCTSKGWWINSENNQTWTNYTKCLTKTNYFTQFEDETLNAPILRSYIPSVKLMSQIGYAISLLTLIIAFSILAFNKRLRCPRNLLHLHLFISFIMRAFMAILKDNLFIKGIGLRNNVILVNGEVVYTQPFHRWECKAFTILWQYFIMANYSWILMEGIYLHNLIFMALFLDKSSIVWHVIMGWSLPAMFVIPWATLRAIYEDTLCWTTNSNKSYFLVIKIPTVSSILINLILFLNITRVLLRKLNSSSSNLFSRRINKYRKWAKSTLVLMPLYGVHYALFLGMSYSQNPKVEIIWLFCDQFFASFQGFCVALLYCILNGEVINEVKSKWGSMKTSVNRFRFGKFSSWRNSESNRRGCDGSTNAQDEDIMDLTNRLLDFAPGVADERLTEEQESALKKATVYFYKQLMLQQNKQTKPTHISLGSSSSAMCRICREAGSKEDLLTTCDCKGTMKFIHLSCLERWLAESDSTKCELCSFQYETVRTPKYSIIKSIILWLQNPGRRRDAREITLDFLASIVFTPMAFFGTYMALLAAETWYNTEEAILVGPTLTRMITLGCVGAIGAIDTAYLSWLLLRARHHARAWHRWRRRNSVVRVILPPTIKELKKEQIDDEKNDS